MGSNFDMLQNKFPPVADEAYIVISLLFRSETGKTLVDPTGCMYMCTRECGASRVMFWLFCVSMGPERVDYSIFYGYNSLKRDGHYKNNTRRCVKVVDRDYY